MMAEFRKPYEGRYRRYSEPGDWTHIEYESKYDLDGNLVLKEIGKTDTYAEIQSHADSCNINLLIARYKAGDENALNRVQGYYADISNIPDIHSVYNTIKSAEQDFVKLPQEVKEKFDNNFEKYLFMVGTDDWYSKMNIEPQKEEIKEVENDGE